MWEKILLWCIGVFAVLPLQGFDLVKNGRPEADIVVAASAHEGEKRAAEDLQFFVKEMTGAELPIVNAPGNAFRQHVFVGENKFTGSLGYKLPAFQNSGYDIVVGKDHLILAGKLVTGRPFPYAVDTPDAIYLRTGKKKPAAFPSKRTKAWWDYVGNDQYFMTGYIENGFGIYIPALKIFVHDDIGAWYAVSALLEKAGVRFYAPYEDGTVLPKRDCLSFEPQRITREAAFSYRVFTSTAVFRSKNPGGALWLKRLMGGTSYPAIYQHNSQDVFGDVLQLENHPEFLACEKPGKRYPGKIMTELGYPRFSNQAFRDACVLYCRKVLDASPGLKAISVGTPDGTTYIDYRDLPVYQKKWNTRDLWQIKANMLWEFSCYVAGELKKSHPQVTFYHWKHYNNTLPTNFAEDDPDNILTPLILTPCSALWVLNSTEPLIRREHLPWVEHNHGKKIRYWDHFLHTKFRGSPPYPAFFGKALQKEMKFIRPYCYGKFIEVINDKSKHKDEISRWNVPLMHLMMYIQMKLFWDPDLDMQTLLDEYYRLYFGPAAAEMKAFHEYAEKVWSRQESRSVTPTSGFLKENDIAEYFRLLEAALVKTPENSVYRRRIDALKLEIEPLKKLFASLKRTGPVYRLYRLPAGADIHTPIEKLFPKLHVFRDNKSRKKVTVNGTRAGFGITRDRKHLLIGIICEESQMTKLKAGCSANDQPGIWNDDLVEIFLNTPERSFFHIAVNANGAVWDRSTDQTIIGRDTLPLLWTPGVQTAVKKYDNRWEAVVKIPTADFGKLGPSRECTWGIDIFRSRRAGNMSAKEPPEVSALYPVGVGSFARPEKWGGLR